MGKEQRQDPRLELPIAGAFRVKEKGSWHEATIKNLSAGGAALTTPFEVPAGNRIDSLRFRLPALDARPERWVKTHALVLRSGPARQREGVPQRILAIKFVDMDELSSRRVQTFVFSQIMDTPDRWRKLRPANKRVELTDAGSVKLRFDTLSEFETQFIGNISTGGMFIRSDNPHPPGTVFDFDLLLGDDLTLVAGRGEVLWIREPFEGSGRTAGMGVRFLEVDDDSLSVVQRVIEAQDAKIGPGEEKQSGGTSSPVRTHQPARSRASSEQDLGKAIPLPSTSPQASPAAAVAQARESMSSPLLDRALEEMRAQRDDLLHRQGSLQHELDSQARSRSELESRLERAELSEKRRTRWNQALKQSLKRSLSAAKDLHGAVERERLLRGSASRDSAALRSRQFDLETELAWSRKDSIHNDPSCAPTLGQRRPELTSLESDKQQIEAALIWERKAGADQNLELEWSRREILALQTQLMSVSTHGEHLRDQLAHKEVSLGGLQRDLELEKGDSESLRRELALQASANRSTQSRLAVERKLRIDHESRLAWSQTELEALDAALQSTLGSVHEISKKSRTERADRERELSFARHEIRRLRFELEQTVSLQTVFEYQHLWDDATIRSLAEGVVSHRLRAQEAQNGLTEARSEIEMLRGTQVQLETDLETSSEEIREAHDLLTKARLEIERLQTSQEQLASDLDLSSKEAREAHGQATAVRLELEELVGTHEQVETQRSSLEVRLSESRLQSSALEARLEATLDKVDDLERRIVTLSDEHTELSEALAAARQRETEFQALVRELENQREDSARDVSRLEKALETTNRRLHSMHHSAAAQEDKIGRLDKHLRRSRRALGLHRKRSASRFAAGGLVGLLAAVLTFGLLPESPPQTLEPVKAETPLPVPRQIEEPGSEAVLAIADDPTPSSQEAQPRPFDTVAVTDAVRAWAEAWAGQRVPDYLGSYSERFEPPFGTSRADWEDLRHQRLTDPDSISIDLVNLEVAPSERGGATATFEQTYSSPGYSDRTLKRLEMERIGNSWKILSETGELMPATP